MDVSISSCCDILSPEKPRTYLADKKTGSHKPKQKTGSQKIEKEMGPKAGKTTSVAMGTHGGLRWGPWGPRGAQEKVACKWRAVPQKAIFTSKKFVCAEVLTGIFYYLAFLVIF